MSDTLPSTIGTRLPKKPEVAVEIPDRDVTEEGAIRALERLGRVKVREKTLTDLETVGIYVRNQGTLKISRGQCMLTQQCIRVTMAEIVEKIQNEGRKSKNFSPKSMTMMAHALCELAGKQTESTKLLVAIERMAQPAMADEPDPISDSFTPGQPVIPAGTHVLINAPGAHITQSPSGSGA
jgi:hypothetical protein